MRLHYLGYPIDQAGEWHGSVALVKGMMRQAGIAFYDPGAAITGAPGLPPGPEIWKINYRALTLCEAALFVLPAGVATVGTPREIQIAVQCGMPTAVLTDGPTWSLPELGPLRTFPINRPEDAIGWLVRQDYRVADRKGDLLWTILCTCPQSSADYDGPAEDCGVHGRPELVSAAKDRQAPRKAYSDDAGYDLTVSTDTWCPLGEAVDIPTGVAVELPSHQFAMIVGRSSTRRVRGLLVHPGVIDPGWRGELFVNAECFRPEQKGELGPLFGDRGSGTMVKAGERIGQLVLMTNHGQSVEPRFVGELAPHERGTRGFGSSGR